MTTTILDTALEANRKELKQSFLTEWTPNQFKIVQKAICKHFLRDGISTSKTRHVIPRFRSDKKVFECIDIVLGLAFTSSSSYAGYWVCNIEAVNDKYPDYRYVGFALTANNKGYAILWDKNETELIIEL